MRCFSIFLLAPLITSCNEKKGYGSPNIEYKIMIKDNSVYEWRNLCMQG